MQPCPSSGSDWGVPDWGYDGDDVDSAPGETEECNPRATKRVPRNDIKDSDRRALV